MAEAAAKSPARAGGIPRKRIRVRVSPLAPFILAWRAASWAARLAWRLAGLLLRAAKLLLAISAVLAGSAAMAVLAAAFLACCAGAVWFIPVLHRYDAYARAVVERSSPSDFQLDESSTVYGASGAPIAVLHRDADLVYVPYPEIPANVVNAFVAVEDRTFWTNSGADFRGIARVILGYIKSHGAEEHGASTITQQLVRGAYLSGEVSLERKLKEICIAMRMGEKYTKRDIMEYYVNDICYGKNIYGIGGAARAYFNKTPAELTLSEAAYLCALPNRPSYYDPLSHPDRAIPRRDKILRDMAECGYITRTQMGAALREEIRISRPRYQFNDYETTFAVDCAVRELMRLDGFVFGYSFRDAAAQAAYRTRYRQQYDKMRQKLYTGGYRIRTSLDHGACRKMQEALDSVLSFSGETDPATGVYALQGASACVDLATGRTVAVVGGRSQALSMNGVYTFNRAYQTRRQPGSSIKPLIVYAPALEKGLDADSMLEEIDVSAAKEPGADPKSMHGREMDLRYAATRSINGAAWKLFNEITPEYGMSFLEKMEYAGLCPDDYRDVASLGGFTEGATVVEQASGYAALASGGIWRDPSCITSIQDRDGNELYSPRAPVRAYSRKAADGMAEILEGVLTEGTAKGLHWTARSGGMEAFGKTGTTNGSRDGWFCGAAGGYSIAVWVGFDRPRELEDLYGATYPGEIWARSQLALAGGGE